MKWSTRARLLRAAGVREVVKTKFEFGLEVVKEEVVEFAGAFLIAGAGEVEGSEDAFLVDVFHATGDGRGDVDYLLDVWGQRHAASSGGKKSHASGAAKGGPVRSFRV
jgi:hypothetical protein